MKAMGKRDRPRHSHDSGIWSPNRHNGVGPRHQIYCKIKKQNRCEHIPTSFYIHTEKKIRIYTFAMEKKFITTNSIHLITILSTFIERQSLECNWETDYNKDEKRYTARYMTGNMWKPLPSSQVTPTNLGNSAKYIWERNQINS